MGSMTPDHGDGPVLEEVPAEECMELVGSLTVGRVAVAAPGQAPLVVPVSYIVDEQTVVFRTGPGTELSRLMSNPLSFQVDFVDAYHRSGWSVLIRGTAAEVEATEKSELDVKPWVGGDRSNWVRVVPAIVTGRRIRLPEIVWDTRGYL